MCVNRVFTMIFGVGTASSVFVYATVFSNVFSPCLDMVFLPFRVPEETEQKRWKHARSFFVTKFIKDVQIVDKGNLPKLFEIRGCGPPLIGLAFGQTGNSALAVLVRWEFFKNPLRTRAPTWQTMQHDIFFVSILVSCTFRRFQKTLVARDALERCSGWTLAISKHR